MAIKKINKYFDKIKAESPYYFIIVILYLSFKRAYFRNKWKWWLQQWKYAKRYIETLFNDYINEKIDKEDKELIKLISKLNCYYNIGLKFIKIRFNNSNKWNNIIPNPLNWQLKIG